MMMMPALQMKHHPSQLTQLQMTRASPVIDEGSAISIFLEEEHQRDSGRQVRSEAALALLAAAVMLLLHYNTHCDYLCVFHCIWYHDIRSKLILTYTAILMFDGDLQ